MYDNEFETKENKILTKDKIEPQHIHLLFPNYTTSVTSQSYPSQYYTLRTYCLVKHTSVH